jgi:hypothetical protein
MLTVTGTGANYPRIARQALPPWPSSVRSFELMRLIEGAVTQGLASPGAAAVLPQLS